MKIDGRLSLLFVFPVFAIILCLASSFVIQNDVRYSPAHPGFLSSIDQLSLFTMDDPVDALPRGFRDVFRHEWILASADLTPYPDTQPMPEAPSAQVTMIMEAGQESFCIINGKKMYLGDKNDGFRVTALGKDSVTITYHNGTRETHHVKAY